MQQTRWAKLSKLWEDLHSNLWFLPSLTVAAAVGLAVALIAIGERIDRGVYEAWPRLFGVGPQGARTMLAAIATSVMTVAGVAFSITIVSLTLASSQYTSRVLRTFLRDRANQTVLGLLVSIFAYCTVVLHTIRERPEDAFVPPLAVLGAVVLALVAVGAVIFFIHHIATSLQASSILAAIGAETAGAVDHFAHQDAGESDETVTDEQCAAAIADQRWHMIPARETGYVQRVDVADLMRFAEMHNRIVRMECGIGEFVIEGMPLVSLSGDAELPADAAEQVNSLYAQSRFRTIEQDPSFGIRQIVDMAVKALSPGVNDTTTAAMCVDYLTAILVRVAQCPLGSPYCLAGDQLRVIARGPTFESLVAVSFDPVRQNAGGNVTVLGQLLRSLQILTGVATRSQRAILSKQHEAIVDEIRRTIPSARDRQELEDQSGQVARLLDGAGSEYPRGETC